MLIEVTSEGEEVAKVADKGANRTTQAQIMESPTNPSINV